jgi:predicted oxidoreductase (fatty acid repression mutant protein)
MELHLQLTENCTDESSEPDYHLPLSSYRRDKLWKIVTKRMKAIVSKRKRKKRTRKNKNDQFSTFSLFVA